MSFDQLKNCENRNKRPYIISFMHPTSKAQLVYYGCEHQNPTNASALEKDILKSLEKFRPSIVAIEGITNSRLITILGSSKNFGYEGDYAIEYYKKNNGTELIGFEQEPSEEIIHLQYKRFSELDITLYYLVRALSSEQNKTDYLFETSETKLVSWVNTIKSTFKFSYPDLSEQEIITSLENLSEASNGFAGVNWGKLIDPANQNKIMNRIGRELCIFRDTKMIEKILTILSKGNSETRFFILMGATHVIMQEPVLEAELLRIENE